MVPLPHLSGFGWCILSPSVLYPLTLLACLALIVLLHGWPSSFTVLCIYRHRSWQLFFPFPFVVTLGYAVQCIFHRLLCLCIVFCSKSLRYSHETC
ncbi:hypothetical protein ARMSODRAFT_967323 [Armillaria solidipes]|uniref:Uncharacterized protein n=1 Tax=Armillaria solidipes TaxID=1076256 RepID=A0A2H3B2R6_9AGAR|nr:hypothetical protein ARMSODRAFT_967323 [Armillaria solidipes]